MQTLRDSLLTHLAARLTEDGTTASPGLLEFIPAVSPTLEQPLHLAPIVEAIESTPHRERRIVISTPPQHGKTKTVIHGLVWLMTRDPRKRHGYVTYESTRAEEMSREAQWVARATGVKTEGSRRIWRVAGQAGGMIAAGIGGPLTGYGIDGVLVVDDPVKNRAEAESTTYRERTHQWFRDVAMSRVHPGASVLVILTRWHPDDLGGRLIGEGWEHINLPAIDDAGRALWEARRPVAWLERQRAEGGEYTWASLWQGQPRPRGGQVFHDVTFYDAAPTTGYRAAFGVDLAYTAKTSSDYSVVVTLAADDSFYYVLDVARQQVRAPQFGVTLGGVRGRYPFAPMSWYCIATEQGVADLLNALNPKIHVRAVPTTHDKFVRAQPVAAAWNEGKVLVPRDAPWLDAFVAELATFTGMNDAHDDQVDALAAAFDLLKSGAPIAVAVGGRRTWNRASADL